MASESIVNLCACGCGKPAQSRFINGHNRSRWKANDERSFLRRLQYRTIFRSIIEIYHEVKATIGQPGAIDYERSDLGKKPYATSHDNAAATVCWDFLADVELSTNLLDGAGHKYIWDNCLDKEPNWDVQSQDFLHWQEKLGKLFLQRRMYPVGEYFRMVRK